MIFQTHATGSCIGGKGTSAFPSPISISSGTDDFRLTLAAGPTLSEFVHASASDGPAVSDIYRARNISQFSISAGNAVPEPGSLALAGLALPGLVASRRRRG